MTLNLVLLRACLKIMWGPVFEQKPGWLGATKKTALREANVSSGNLISRTWEVNIPCGSSTEEQQRQAGFCSKTRRAAALLTPACVGSPVTARYGDVPGSSPRGTWQALAAAKIPRRRTSQNFETGSNGDEYTRMKPGEHRVALMPISAEWVSSVAFDYAE